jgi:hypothetical protein
MRSGRDAAGANVVLLPEQVVNEDAVTHAKRLIDAPVHAPLAVAASRTE